MIGKVTYGAIEARVMLLKRIIYKENDLRI